VASVYVNILTIVIPAQAGIHRIHTHAFEHGAGGMRISKVGHITKRPATGANSMSEFNRLHGLLTR